MVDQVQEFNPAALVVQRRQADSVDLAEVGSDRAPVPRQERAEPGQFPGSPKTSW